ncbi:FG-GAP-like repeat-containing protein, partial [Myxococcota bacterium]|nr:FG-GAP-like repeat-containing protein [Myxococcota bacterium]
HGTSVAGAGDVDGDGKADVVVGAPEWSGPLGAEGRVALYLGGGICNVLDWYADADLDGFGDPGTIASACVVPAGYVADDTDCDDADPGIYPGAPEVCGDGVDGDCLGAASGCVLEGDLSASAADVYLVGEQGGDRAGHAVAHADLDGDGYQDLLVGAPGYPGGLSAGALYVVYGPVWGTIDLSLADARIEGEAAGDLAGYSVSGAGDLDGDGNEDVLVGAPGVGVVGGKEGAAYVLYGPLTGTGSLATAGAKMTGEAMGDGAGTAVAAAGDVNGDGSPDLAVGAPFYDGRGVDSGAAYLVLGPVWGVMDLSLADATLMGPRRGEQAGWSLAGGDFDGDGRGDLLVGAPGSRAGGPGSGAAYLARGPVLGRRNLGTVAAATLVGEGPQDQAGWSVASAGDVDGDGADDVLVGARRFDGGGTDAGAAYLLAGSPTGTIDLSLADASLTGYVSLDLAGAAVGGGGD